jgi:hypothetical protein
LLALIKRQNKLAAQLLARAERRYDLGSNRLVWRRAYPYEGRA